MLVWPSGPVMKSFLSLQPDESDTSLSLEHSQSEQAEACYHVHLVCVCVCVFARRFKRYSVINSCM